MKIQGTRPVEVTSTSHAHATARAHEGRIDAGASVADPQTDQLDVSSDARLAEQAVKAATDAPDIRPQAVERARQKLAAGQVGNDLHRLADKLIDSLLGFLRDR